MQGILSISQKHVISHRQELEQSVADGTGGVTIASWRGFDWMKNCVVHDESSSVFLLISTVD